MRPLPPAPAQAERVVPAPTDRSHSPDPQGTAPNPEPSDSSSLPASLLPPEPLGLLASRPARIPDLPEFPLPAASLPPALASRLVAVQQLVPIPLVQRQTLPQPEQPQPAPGALSPAEAVRLLKEQQLLL